MHQHIPKNDLGRDFVVGDIHGHIDLFAEKLSYEGFDETKDRVFSVGDLIDRGPDSLACLKLLDLPWFYAVRGNHEQMMIDWASGESFPSWQREFGGWLDGLEPSEVMYWVDKVKSLPISMTIEGSDYLTGICHAEPCGYDWTAMIFDQTAHQQMMWGRKVLRGQVNSGLVNGVDITVHGHTPVPQVRRIGNRHFIDTGAGVGEYLTVLNIADMVANYREFSRFA